MNEQEQPKTQVFAAEGRLRGHAVRAALIGGGLLLAAWLAALVLGSFGGLGGLPGIDLTGKPEARSAKSGSPTPGKTADVATHSVAQPVDRASAGPAPSHGGSSSRPAAAPGTTGPAPAQPSATTHGKPAGSGTGSGSGKPAGTPGNGNSTSNAGGQGKGNAYGTARTG